MAGLPPEVLSPRSRLIMTYAMCGFANFGSLGIMIGGMSAMVPERRHEVVELGMNSIGIRHPGHLHDRMHGRAFFQMIHSG